MDLHSRKIFNALATILPIKMQYPAWNLCYWISTTYIAQTMTRFCHYWIPPLNIRISFISSHKILKNFSYMRNIILQFSINVIFNHRFKFSNQFNPIFSYSCHVDIIYTTSYLYFSYKSKKLLKWTHNDRSGDQFVSRCCGGEIALKAIYNSFESVLFNLENNLFKEVIPLLL